MLSRMKNVLCNDEATSTLEIVMWLGVVIVICSFLLYFSQTVWDFIAGVRGNMGNESNNVTWSVQENPVNLVS